MPQEKSKVKVTIFGDTYVLTGDATSEYMEIVAEYVNQKMLEISSHNPRLTGLKVAILSAINVADELIKLRKQNSELIERFAGSYSQPANQDRSKRQQVLLKNQKRNEQEKSSPNEVLVINHR